MTQEELIARAEDLIAAWNQGDIDRIVAAFSVEARTGVRLEVEALFERFPDVELETLRTVAAGHVVTTEWLARSQRDGQPARRSGVSVADYDARGRIARHRCYWR